MSRSSTTCPRRRETRSRRTDAGLSADHRRAAGIGTSTVTAAAVTLCLASPDGLPVVLELDHDGRAGRNHAPTVCTVTSRVASIRAAPGAEGPRHDLHPVGRDRCAADRLQPYRAVDARSGVPAAVRGRRGCPLPLRSVPSRRERCPPAPRGTRGTGCCCARPPPVDLDRGCAVYALEHQSVRQFVGATQELSIVCGRRTRHRGRSRRGCRCPPRRMRGSPIIASWGKRTGVPATSLPR